MLIKVKRLHQKAILPKYATDGSGCFDLHNTNGFYSFVKSSPVVIDTGLAFEIPKGYTMLIFSRSGHGFKNDVRLANCVGVIDSDYRGEIKVKLTNDNMDGKCFNIEPGDRIAQACVVKTEQVEFLLVDELSETERGTGGFGSTGKGVV